MNYCTVNDLINMSLNIFLGFIFPNYLNEREQIRVAVVKFPSSNIWIRFLNVLMFDLCTRLDSLSCSASKDESSLN